MERGLAMLAHSVVIGILLYVLLVYLLGQKASVAENRSILFAAVILIYMLLFGHGLPNSINKTLF
jgi:high-affinity Fe2+/Pb2+ permease